MLQYYNNYEFNKSLGILSKGYFALEIFVRFFSNQDFIIHL
jgi:hypothetical protein